MAQSRILLADDHSLILEGVRRLIENHYEVVGCANDGKSLVEAALRQAPDLVILDIGMPILNGIDAAREIKKPLPATKCLFLSMQSNPIYLRKAWDVGASGYVLKSGASEELLTAVEVARKGGSLRFSGVWLRSNREPSKLAREVQPSRNRVDQPYQREILQLIRGGQAKQGNCRRSPRFR